MSQTMLDHTINDSNVSQTVAKASTSTLSDSRCRGRQIHAFDWLRAALTIVVLMFHSAVPYLLVPFPGLRWSTHEPVGSAFVDACGWIIAAVAMPAFFLLSGYLSARMYASRGANCFFFERSRRLLPTLLFGLVFILPATAYAWFLGWAAQGFMPLDRLLLWGIPDHLEEGLYGVGHLWFLELLWVFCLAAWLIHQLLGRFGFPLARMWQRGSTRLLSSFAMPLVLAIPGAIVLAIEPRVAIGFQHTWCPQLLKLLYYAPCFAAGFWLRDCPNEASTLIRWCELRLMLASGLFAVLLPRIHEHELVGFKGYELWWLVSSFSAFAWLGATGLMGACLKYLDRPAPQIVSHISQASLWIYMVHVPIVGLLQVDLLRVPLPLVLKFSIVVAVGLIMALASFYVVHGTWIGRVIVPRADAREPIRLKERVRHKSMVAQLSARFRRSSLSELGESLN